MSTNAASASEGNNPAKNPSLSVVPSSGPKRKHAQGAFTRLQLAELDKAGQVAQQALNPEHLRSLVAQGKSGAFINALVAKIKSAGVCGTGAISGEAEGVSATVSGTVAKKKLVRRLRQIQAKAKLKFQFDDPAQLRAYLVGQPIAKSRASLEASAQTILTKAGQDRPAGIDTEFLNAAEAERALYAMWKTAHRDKRAQARRERIARNQFVESIRRDRIELQLAADAAWPAGVPENAPVRVLFYLTADRAYNG